MCPVELLQRGSENGLGNLLKEQCRVVARDDGTIPDPFVHFHTYVDLSDCIVADVLDQLEVLVHLVSLLRKDAEELQSSSNNLELKFLI